MAILAETGLSFLGFGVQPPDVSLGTLIADGTKSVTTFPWVFLFPAGVLVMIMLCANLVRRRPARRARPRRSSAATTSRGGSSEASLLQVTDLSVTFPTDAERVNAVRGMSFRRRRR